MVASTHNLATGVGVLVSMVMFACRVAHFVTVERIVRTVDGHETATYVVDGEGPLPHSGQETPSTLSCVDRIGSCAAVFFVNVRDAVPVSVDGLFRLHGTVLTVPGAQDCRR